MAKNKIETIDLTQTDDEVISRQEQYRLTNSYKSRVEARVREKEQQASERKRRVSQNQALIRSGAPVLELLSDEDVEDLKQKEHHKIPKSLKTGRNTAEPKLTRTRVHATEPVSAEPNLVRLKPEAHESRSDVDIIKSVFQSKPCSERQPLAATLPTPCHTPASEHEDFKPTTQSTVEPYLVYLHTDDIERALKRHHEALHQHQEALVKHRLTNAFKLQRSYVGPQRRDSSVDPFKNLAAKPSADRYHWEEGKLHKLAVLTSRILEQPGKKPKPEFLSASTFSSNIQSLPNVRSISRLGASRGTLARNTEILTHMPWFPDNEIGAVEAQEGERYEDVQKAYEIDIRIRSMQRQCRALGKMWKSQMLSLLQELGIEVADVTYYLFHEDENEKPAPGTLCPEMDKKWEYREACCYSCPAKIGAEVGPEAHQIKNSIVRPPTERRLAMAGLLCQVFLEVIEIHVWHAISEMEATRKLPPHSPDEQREDHISTDVLRTLCYACCEFKCTTHGAYAEAESTSGNADSASVEQDSDAIRQKGKESSPDNSQIEANSQKEVVLDDEEPALNKRAYAALPVREKSTGPHQCGVFCLPANVSVVDILGQQHDGSISGVARSEMQDTEPPTFEDSELCDSKCCFWNTKNRKQQAFEAICHTLPNNTVLGAERDLFQTLFSMELTSRRGPCQLAPAFSGVTCVQLFYLLLASFRAPGHSTATSEKPDTGSTIKNRKVDRSNDQAWELRESFIPCSHPGSCEADVCTCARNKISCEPSCGCPQQCDRRFKGCTCRDRRRRVCFADTRCECWAANRECSPELCACGVEEILDPVNKGREDLNERCRNNQIQLGIPKRTIMGISEVHGWGLYAGENISKFGFVSEYKGELISISEGDRRGAVYHNVGLEYLFRLSKDQELDGSLVSNKTRFINNSSLQKNINLLPKTMLCNGVSRVMLYAARDIAAGEELFYEYGYQKFKRASFKEKPELGKRLLLPPSTANTTVGIAALAPRSRTSAPSEPELPVFRFGSHGNEIGGSENQSMLPPSDPESEFGRPDDESSEESSCADERSDESSDDSDTPLLSLRGSSGPSRLGSRSGSFTHVAQHDRASSPPLQSPNDRPRKKIRLTLTHPRALQDLGMDGVAEVSGDVDAWDQSNDVLQRGSITLRPRNSTATSILAAESRRRRVFPERDRRFGGAAQRKAAETLRRRKEAEQREAERRAV